MNSETFHLRGLNLNASNVISILNFFEIKSSPTITSISFSNNPEIGDIGAIEIANQLPKSIREIGLVNCGITDSGGKEILNSIQNLTHLKMLCIKKNSFTSVLINKFQKYQSEHVNTVIIT